MPIMTLSLLILVAIMFTFGVPIAVSLGLSALVVLTFLSPVSSMQILPQLFGEAATSFVLLAVPLFILAGFLMEKGTVGKNLVDFTSSIVGWTTGGLANAGIVSSMIFGGISGSSLADTATFGTILVPRMVDDEYPEDYATAVVLSSSTLAVVIPPSILMVLAAACGNQSVGKALAGGLVPGVFITLCLLAINIFICKKRGYGGKVRFSFRNVWRTFLRSWTALIAPLIILGAIFSGVVTPTEGAAVAVLYVLLIDFFIFRKLTVADIVVAVRRAAYLTAAILFIVTSTAIANWILAYDNVPKFLGAVLSDLPGGKFSFLLIMDFLLLLIGMTIDATPACIIFTPLFLPIAQNLGIDPTHFIVIMVCGFALGLATPPYGVCLFSMASITGLPMDKIIRETMPFYVAIFIALLVITFFPPLTLVFPTLIGM
jgi:tripartite ATP-independent transporter DctM subunit